MYPTLRFLEHPGSWWHQEHEIDVVGRTATGTLLAGEVKFTTQPVGFDVLSRLREEATRIDWTPPDGGDPEYQFALFSRSGFKQSVQEAAAEDEALQLYSLDDVVETLE